MLSIIERLFCRHEWEVGRIIGGGYYCISGEQLYKRCKKCGKLKKYIYREFEGNGYR